MHKLIKKEQCPLCAAEGKDSHKDNLVVYDDGMKYCFARHKIIDAPIRTAMNQMWRSYNESEFRRADYEQVSTYQKVPERKEMPVVQDHFVNWAPSQVALPRDATKELPKSALLWLAKYALGKEEAEKFGAVYSPECDRLVFPIQLGEKLMAWQGRYMGTDVKRPKWWTDGNCSGFSYILHGSKKVPENPKFIVAVEDVVSAIKVSKLYDCVPLLGSIFPKQRMMGLAKDYNHLILWLDADMIRKMNEYRQVAMMYFDTVQLIATAKDPKEMSLEDIETKVGQRIIRMTTA